MKTEWKQIIGIIVAISLCFTINADYDRWSEIFSSTLKCYRRYSKEDIKNEIYLKTKVKLLLYKYLKKYRYVVFGLILSILVASIYAAYQMNSGIAFFDIHPVPDLIQKLGILFLVKQDNRFTIYETHEMRTITINSPLTFRFSADSIEYKTIMAIALKHAKVQPQAKYQRNCFSNASIATMVDLPSGQTVQSINTNYKNHGPEVLGNLTPGELLKAEEKEKVLQYLKEDLFLTPNKIAKKLKKEGHTSVSVAAVKNSLRSVDLSDLLFHFRSQVTGEKINTDKNTLTEMLFGLIKDLLSHQGQSTCITVDKEALYAKYHDIRAKQISMKGEETKRKRDSGILKHWKRLKNMKPYMEDRFKSYQDGTLGTPRCCPGCKTTDIHVKQTRTRFTQNSDGEQEKVKVTSYTCNNSSCSRKTFTAYTGETLPYLRSCRKLICYAFSQRFKRVSYGDIDLKDIGDGSAEVDKGTIARWVVWASVIMPRWYKVFEPRTTGQIAIDEKYAKVRGKWYYVFIAIDIASFDILHIEVYKTRDKDSARHFLYALKSFGFTFDTIITDGTTIYSKPIADLFPETKHIKCVLHLGRSCRNRLMKVFGSYKNKDYLYLKDYIVQIYQAKNEKEFDKAMKDWEIASKHLWELHGEKYPDLKVFMDKFAQDKEKNKERLKDNESPRTTNNVERVIQEFEKRYCNMEGFDTLEAARGWCKLFQVYFRLRPFNDGKFKGKSPAEIMGYDVKNLDSWLDFVIPPDNPGIEKRTPEIA